MTVSTEQLLQNFREQQKTVAENIQKIEFQLNQQKELFLKLQGAIEAFELVHPPESEETTEPEVSEVTVEE
jgi:hypothetical protein